MGFCAILLPRRDFTGGRHLLSTESLGFLPFASHVSSYSQRTYVFFIIFTISSLTFSRNLLKLFFSLFLSAMATDSARGNSLFTDEELKEISGLKKGRDLWKSHALH
ncbi:hypothetical protein KSP40_PGU001401 [Platanthera guangdongensis]|uniref:Uncharacterized protein n=1 Tax=Platanthera guangdongensis TaxID=2320717 RepID=A0ABR2MTP2_9ASPA